MTLCLLLIGDGRHDYRARTLASAAEVGLLDQVDHTVEIDDTDHRLGFAGAIQAGWDQVASTGADWIFHLEADFTFNGPVDVEAMTDFLAPRRGWLAQVVLKRQPWNDAERAAGGIIEQHPGDYDEWGPATLHDRFFSTNPCLYHRRITEFGWPQESESEGKFSAVLRDEGYRFAFWGSKFAPPAVHHIGAERAGRGY